MSHDLLTLLLDDAHDIEMMRRTLDMTSLYHPNHMLGCINGVEEVRRDHPNQSPILPLRMGEAEDEEESVVDFHAHYRVCYEILRDLHYCDMTCDMTGKL